MSRVSSSKPTTAPVGPLEGFNSDLLIHAEDLDLARRKYPSVFHVLDHPKLRDEFARADSKANDAKKGTQKTGILAVVLAAVALAISTASALWHGVAHPWPQVIAGLAAVLSIASLLMALGMLHGEQKDKWLRNRLRTERIRQFFFQTVVLRIDDIAKSVFHPPGAQAAFAKQREIWFDNLQRKLDDSGQIVATLNEILDANVSAQPWVHSVRPPVRFPGPFDGTELFAAYLELRIDVQLAYANTMLSHDDWTLRFRKLSLLQQRDVLRYTWVIAIAMLVGLHVWILVGAVAPQHGPNDLLAHVGVIWLALIALAARTIQHGLCLASDIERYTDYRSEVKALRDRFVHPSADSDAKLDVMIEMERASFDEMRRFLRSRREASFVM